MDFFWNSLKNINPMEGTLMAILIAFFIIGLDVPEQVSDAVDTLPSKILIFIIVAYLFLYSNTVLAVLFLIVAFDLMLKSGVSNLSFFQGTHEQEKQRIFTSLNEQPYTLEQEIVKKMTPRVNSSRSITLPTFLPTLESDHDATLL